MSKEIAEIIIIELRRQGKTQTWLAEELKETKQNLCLTLKKMEKGKTIDVEKLDRIGKILGITFHVGA